MPVFNAWVIHRSVFKKSFGNVQQFMENLWEKVQSLSKENFQKACCSLTQVCVPGSKIRRNCNSLLQTSYVASWIARRACSDLEHFDEGWSYAPFCLLYWLTDFSALRQAMRETNWSISHTEGSLKYIFTHLVDLATKAGIHCQFWVFYHFCHFLSLNTFSSHLGAVLTTVKMKHVLHCIEMPFYL